MKTKSFTLVILAIFGMVIFTNYTSKNTKETDASSLLFMLEEEKLAHDVYTFLYSKWETRPFANIKESEKVHMQKIQELLDQNKISYEILPEGKFKWDLYQSVSFDPFYEKESRESLNKIKAFLLELLIDGGCPLNAESDRAEAPADNGADSDSERTSGGAEQAESVHS